MQTLSAYLNGERPDAVKSEEALQRNILALTGAMMHSTALWPNGNMNPHGSFVIAEGELLRAKAFWKNENHIRVKLDKAEGAYVPDAQNMGTTEQHNMIWAYKNKKTDIIGVALPVPPDQQYSLEMAMKISTALAFNSPFSLADYKAIRNFRLENLRAMATALGSALGKHNPTQDITTLFDQRCNAVAHDLMQRMALVMQTA